ncbi:hypothetical protein ACB098_03G180700 [Castanea mollissima]
MAMNYLTRRVKEARGDESGPENRQRRYRQTRRPVLLKPELFLSTAAGKELVIVIFDSHRRPQTRAPSRPRSHSSGEELKERQYTNVCTSLKKKTVPMWVSLHRHFWFLSQNHPHNVTHLTILVT